MEKRKNNHISAKFRAIVLFIITILLPATLCSAEFVDVGETADIDYAIEFDYLLVRGTANLYPGAYVDWGIYAATGSTVNIYGGQIGDGFFVMLYAGEPIPDVTVYGTNFKLDGVPLDPSVTEFTVDRFTGGVLTGDYANGDSINLWFLSDAPINVRPPDAGIAIDIKPGNEENNINLKSNGVVPVAVLTMDDFDAATVDAATAEFAGAAPERWKLEDVDNDGDDDLLLHFRTQELELDQNSTEATLTAQLIQLESQMSIRSTAQVSGGTTISGTDKVRIVSSGRSKK